MGYTAGYAGAYGVMIPEGRFVLIDATSIDWEASDVPVGHFVLRDYTNSNFEAIRESYAQWNIASATSVVYTSYVTTSGAFGVGTQDVIEDVQWYSPRQAAFELRDDTVTEVETYRESSAEYYAGNKTYLKYIGNNLYYRDITIDVGDPQVSIEIGSLRANELSMTVIQDGLEIYEVDTEFEIGNPHL